MDNVRVHLDDSDLRRALQQLSAGIGRRSERTGYTQAVSTASRIRGRVPVRTGRLAATVHAGPSSGGGSVTYGGGLPYARYIEKRSHAVRDGLRGVDVQYQRAMSDVAETEARRI
jgi:hypothetical protein